MTKWVITQIFGGIVRFLTVAVISAVCLVWGFAPNEWFAKLWTAPPLWLAHPLTRLAVLCLGVGFVWFLIWSKKTVNGTPLSHSDESASIREVMYWIDEKSAWGRWQKVQNSWLVREPEQQTTKWFWISEIDDKAKSGRLKIDARRNNQIEREKIERDFWDIACFDAVPNDRSIWRITVRPKDGLSRATITKIQKLDYVDLRAKWSEVKDIWPEQNKVLDRLTRGITHKKIDRNKRLTGVLAASLLLITSATLWRVYFAPIEPSLGIEDALIRPYPRDKNLLEVGFQFKNVSNMDIYYGVQDFAISVGDDKRLYLSQKAKNASPIPRTMGTQLWFSPFSEGLNTEQKTFLTFDVVIEYGATKDFFERVLTAKFSCDLVLGKLGSTDCMIEKEADKEIP